MTDYIYDDLFTDADFAAMLGEDDDCYTTMEDELADRGMSMSDFI